MDHKDLEDIPFVKNDPFFQKLLKAADIRNLSEEERLEYEKSLQRYRDEMLGDDPVERKKRTSILYELPADERAEAYMQLKALAKSCADCDTTEGMNTDVEGVMATISKAARLRYGVDYADYIAMNYIEGYIEGFAEGWGEE